MDINRLRSLFYATEPKLAHGERPIIEAPREDDDRLHVWVPWERAHYRVKTGAGGSGFCIRANSLKPGCGRDAAWTRITKVERGVYPKSGTYRDRVRIGYSYRANAYCQTCYEEQTKPITLTLSTYQDLLKRIFNQQRVEAVWGSVPELTSPTPEGAIRLGKAVFGTEDAGAVPPALLEWLYAPEQGIWDISERQRKILVTRLALNDISGKITLEATGKLFKITGERVAQLERRAISWLRRAWYGR